MCTIIIHFSISEGRYETSPLKVFVTHKDVHEVRRLRIVNHKLFLLEELKVGLQELIPLLLEHDFTISWKGKQNCNYFYVTATGILK
jgi:DNA-binding GntR family transcriptional regulator